MLKLSKKSEVVSTLNAKGCVGYWDELCAEMSSRLWLPTKTVLQDLEQTSSSSFSTRMAENSWFSTKFHFPPKKNLPEICSQFYTYFHAGFTVCESTSMKSRKIRIYPTAKQRQLLRQWLGTSRYVYNQTIEYLRQPETQANWITIKKWLLKNFATVQVEERKDIELDIVRTRGNNRFIEGDKRFVSEEELDKYRWTHPYWAKRGITDERIIELFDLGYDKDTNCITFPLRDKKGNCLFVARRSVCTKYFHYPEGVEKPVYAEYELYQLQEFPRTVYITESMIDCLTLWQIGKYACALNGLGTVLQIEQLNKMPCRHFVLATDNDEAGMRARKNLAQKLKNKIITQVIFPENRKDINECTENELLNLKEVFV